MFRIERFQDGKEEKSYPEITTLPKLAELLEISVDELLRGSIEK